MAHSILIFTIEEHRVVGVRQEISPAELQGKYTAANQDELSGG
jgi:hypothetical protein